VLAVHNGEIPISNPRAIEKYKKSKQLLSQKLEEYFGLFDPFYPFEKDNSYRIQMTLFPPEDGFSFEKRRNETTPKASQSTSPYDDLEEVMSELAPSLVEVEKEKDW
jgi:hypothetical protein